MAIANFIEGMPGPVKKAVLTAAILGTFGGPLTERILAKDTKTVSTQANQYDAWKIVDDGLQNAKKDLSEKKDPDAVIFSLGQVYLTLRAEEVRFFGINPVPDNEQNARIKLKEVIHEMRTAIDGNSIDEFARSLDGYISYADSKTAPRLDMTVSQTEIKQETKVEEKTVAPETKKDETVQPQIIETVKKESELKTDGKVETIAPADKTEVQKANTSTETQVAVTGNEGNGSQRIDGKETDGKTEQVQPNLSQTESDQTAPIARLRKELKAAKTEDDMDNVISEACGLVNKYDMPSIYVVNAYISIFNAIVDKAAEIAAKEQHRGVDEGSVRECANKLLDAIDNLTVQANKLNTNITNKKSPEVKKEENKAPEKEIEQPEKNVEQPVNGNNGEDLNVKKTEKVTIINDEDKIEKNVEKKEDVQKAPEQKEKSDGSETLKVRKTSTGENKETNETPVEKKEPSNNDEDLKIKNANENKQAPVEKKTEPVNGNTDGSERLGVKKQNAPVDEATALKNVNNALMEIEADINSLTQYTSADDVKATQDRVESLSKTGEQVFEKYSDLSQKFLELKLKLSVTLTDIESERNK